MDVTTGTDTDEAIVRAMARGDKNALARAFDRYAATLTRYAWALVDDRQDVEEVVQDAFLTLWQRAETLELPADTMLPWLLVVCRNHAFNTGRKQARRRTDELPEQLAAPEDHAEARERLRWVRDAIAALPTPTDASASSASSRGTPTPRPPRCWASASVRSPSGSPATDADSRRW